MGARGRGGGATATTGLSCGATDEAAACGATATCAEGGALTITAGGGGGVTRRGGAFFTAFAPIATADAGTVMLGGTTRGAGIGVLAGIGAGTSAPTNADSFAPPASARSC